MVRFVYTSTSRVLSRTEQWESESSLSIAGTLNSLLAKISKMPVQNSNSKIVACPDLATQLLQILIYKLYLKAYCVKKGNLHFSHVLEDDLLVITPKSQNKKFFIEILPAQKGGFQETACPKDMQDGSWLSLDENWG